MSNTIYREINDCDFQIETFKAAVSVAPPRRFRGICGFDGFIDTFIHMQEPNTMAALGPKITAAAGIAASYVVHHQGDKFGGNGPLLASALHGAFAGGIDTTYIGALGDGAVLPIFQEALADKTSALFTLAEPAHSDCLEFEDGKIMLSDMRSCEAITWQRLLERVGDATLNELLQASDFIAAVNWGKLPHAGTIWAQLAQRLHELQVPAKQVTCFMDLAEFEQRPPEDRLALIELMPAISAQCSTMLSFNLKEAWLMAETLRVPCTHSMEPESVADCAASLRRHIDVDRVIIHPNNGAACASADACVYVPGPFCAHPLISTGAGDHFGAGCLAGSLMGLDDVGILLAGACSSGYFVRSGRSPSFANMVALWESWRAGNLAERL